MRPFVLAAGALAITLASSAQAQFAPSRPGTPIKNLPQKQQPQKPQEGLAPAKPFAPAVSPTTTTPPPAPLLAGGSDNCANASTADAISGNGTFAIDSTAATSGSPIGSCGGIANDVWFYWTPTVTGTAQISTCGLVGADSVIAAWTSAGPGVCPSTQITCLDDFCGLQTTISFPVTAGTSYYLEFGSFGGGAGYTGSFSTTVFPPPANDACTAPTAITGTGSFALATVGASTGAQGQAEAACNSGGVTNVYNDVWYAWTASFTGNARLETCGLVTYNSKAAVYAGSTCPGGAALACNDNACGVQTRLDWPVTSGQVYLLQIGSQVSTGAASAGSGSFTIQPFVPATNDDCSMPTTLVGAGPYAFDTTASSTGSQGQANSNCLFFGSTAIYNDVWFVWNATFTGTARLSTCGGAAFDTKVAIYGGNTCPGAGAIACNDDACALQSRVEWQATSGQNYLIQLGSFGNGVTGVGTFTIQQFLPVAFDDCQLATAISGTGNFPVNTVGMTNGSPIGGCGGMGTDGWFHWTATSSGIAQVSTCGLTTADSVLAAWVSPGVGICPTQQLACNDDSCNFQSRITFPATSGTSYYIEVGSFAGGAGWTGSMQIDIFPAPVNDDCATPTALVGNGPHPFNTLGASQGTQGQNEALCLFFGTPAMGTDVWFTWVAPSSGSFSLSMCGTAAYDAKLAVYNGAGCPTGSAIACDDDFCGFAAESAVCFTAVAGQTYTIQVGGFGAAVGNGTMTFAPQTTTAVGCTAADDGSSDNSIGLTAGGGMGWLVRFGDIGSSTSVSAVRTCFGTPMFPGAYPAGGTVTVAVWEDPNDDGDPTDAVLLSSASATVGAGAIDSDVLQSVPLTSAVTATGVFFAGATVTHAAGQIPAPLDQTGGGGGSPCSSSGARSWVVGNVGSPLNLMTLGANSIPPATIAGVGFPGNWLLRIDCGAGSPGTPFCFGDASGGATACPCGNNSTQAGAGCQHSFSVANWGGAGGLLAATGVSSISNDTLRLVGTQLPPGPPTLFFQGTAQISGGAGVTFGDGLRCAGGIVTRLGQRPAVSGAISFGFGIAGDPQIHTQGLVGAPGVRYYQLWYRNNAVFCTPDPWNLTNGITVTWNP